MASITDCVVEGLKYPFNDIKKLLGLGVLFALISALSTFISTQSFEVSTITMNFVENANGTVSQMAYSQLPTGNIYLIIGLSVLSFIVSLFILGYQYDIVKFAIDKKPELPGFNDVIDLFVKGIKYFIVVVAYNVIPMIVLFAGMVFGGDVSVMMVFILISVVLFIIAYFLLVMAINNMVAHDSIKKAFDFKEITYNIANFGWGKYVGIIIFTVIVYVIIMVAVSFVLSFITVALSIAIPNQIIAISIVVAIIEGLFIDSYASIFLNRVCGSIYRESIK